MNQTVEQLIWATNTGNIVRKCGSHIMVPGVPQRVPLEFVTLYGHDHFVYDFTTLAEKLQSRTEDGRLMIDFRSPLSAVDGYGRHAIWLVRALQRAGVEVSVRDVGWVDNAFLPQDIMQMKYASNLRLPAKIGVSFTLGYDPQLAQHSSLVKIGITQFETNRLPFKQAQNVNKLDHCVVTSSFGVKMFRKSGVTVPISVMTPGIEISEFPYKADRPMGGKFKVLLFGALTKRKNPMAAIRIFQKASKGNPDWELTIKSRPQAQGIRMVERAAYTDPRIKVLLVEDPPNEIVKYYHDHHCLLWPSLGEGVGLPPLEAMATGMELVCSASSGMLDYLNGDWSYPIKIDRMESAAGPDLFNDEYIRAWGDVGEWWVPNEDHAAKQLERCFNNWLDGKGKGAKAAQVVRERFTIDHSAKSLIQVLEKYA